MKHLSYLRYFVLATALVATLTSCRRDELASGAEYGELTLTPTVDGVSATSTRTSSISITDIQTHGFYVAGYLTQGPIDLNPGEAYPNVFDKDVNDNQTAVPLVTYNSSNKFTLKTIKWALDPNTGLSFFAWTQNKAIPTTGVTATTTGIISQTSTQKGYPRIDIRNADQTSQQVDIIGSRSINSRNDAVISAVDLDFSHLLAKITIQTKSTTGAKLQITAANIKYAANKVYKKARYTFTSISTSLGAYSQYAEYHTGTTPIGSTYPAIPAGTTATLGDILLIPQDLDPGALTLELKYTISTNGTQQGDEQTKTLPLPANTFESGQNYLYTIDVQGNQIIFTGDPILTPWDMASTTLPLVPGPKGDLLLLLDGYQKPYLHTDGKWYWLDRSGYNRHVELVGYTDGMYNNGSHSYTFSGASGVYAQAPAFPTSVTTMNIDAVAQNTPGVTSTSQRLIDFCETATTNPRFRVQMGANGGSTLTFDCSNSTTAGQGRLTFSVLDPADYGSKVMWSFEKTDGGAQRIFRTLAKEAEAATSGSGTLKNLNLNTIGQDYAGSVSYIRVASSAPTNAQRRKTIEDLVLRFGVTPPPPPPPPPPTAISRPPVGA